MGQFERAVLNTNEARRLRASGFSYCQIKLELGIGSRQLCRIRAKLRREKAVSTVRCLTVPCATNRDLPISCSALPPKVRKILTSGGVYHTLGDLADRLTDRRFKGLEGMPGIGPYRAALVSGLLDRLDVRSLASELKSDVELVFPGLLT